MGDTSFLLFLLGLNSDTKSGESPPINDIQNAISEQFGGDGKDRMIKYLETPDSTLDIDISFETPCKIEVLVEGNPTKIDYGGNSINTNKIEPDDSSITPPDSN